VNIFQQALDDREAQPRGQVLPPEERLLRFDAWVRAELASRLDWSWAGVHKEKRIEQCRVYLERMVIALWRRGWMLDGRRLAARIEAMLDAFGTYQRAGKVADFWPYFRATVDRYVGQNAEEIQREALAAGSHVSQALAAVLAHRPSQGPSLPELVAQRAGEVAEAKEQTLRQRQARLLAARKADARQGKLL
jgi:hypothetical protein